MQSSPKFSRLTLLLLSVFAVLLVSFLGLLVGDFYYTKERFPPNVFIENVEVSLLTKEQAATKISLVPVDEVFPTAFALAGEIGAYHFKPSSLGIFVLPRESVERAFAFTHAKGYLNQLGKRLTKPKLVCPAVAEAEENILKETLVDLAAEINVSSKDAAVDFQNSQFYALVPEVTGRELEIEKSLAQIKAALKQGEKVLPLAIAFYPPHITLKDLEAFPPIHLLSKYTTYYGSHDSRNRISNIKLIASLLEGQILLSGETLSLLSIIGDFSEERGFKEAFVIVGDELVPQEGGGTCQIATTLFNAAALAGLKIVERKNHSIWFNIYPLGRDATVYPRVADFRFLNDLPHPILIRAKATNRYLTFQVYGTPGKRKASFTKTQVEGRIGVTPFRTKAVRIIEEEGQETVKDEFRSFYKMAGDSQVIKIRRPEPR